MPIPILCDVSFLKVGEEVVLRRTPNCVLCDPVGKDGGGGRSRVLVVVDEPDASIANTVAAHILRLQDRVEILEKRISEAQSGVFRLNYRVDSLETDDNA